MAIFMHREGNTYKVARRINDLNQLVRKLVRDKLTDGQLDRSQLTFRDLDTICNAFYTVLTGVFHERIEYPDVKLPPRVEPLPEAPEKDGDKEA